MTIKNANAETITESVFCRLRGEILSGEFAPGESLPGERRLVTQLNANRGAIREAMKRLEQSKLVEIHHGGNTRVLDFRNHAGLEIVPQLLDSKDGLLNITVARSMVELRTAITPDMTRMAAIRNGKECAAALRLTLAEMREALKYPDRLPGLQDEYWESIARHSDNIAYQLILNTFRELRVKQRALISQVLLDCYSDLGLLEQISHAMEEGDASSAEEAARARSEQIFRALTKAAKKLQKRKR